MYREREVGAHAHARPHAIRGISDDEKLEQRKKVDMHRMQSVHRTRLGKGIWFMFWEYIDIRPLLLARLE